MKSVTKTQSVLHVGLIRVTRAHFLYVLALVIQIMIYDAAKLITRDVVYQRWVATIAFLVVIVFVWFIARTRIRSNFVYKLLLFTLILVDIGFASYQVYSQRGMASRAVVLYLIPIIVSAVMATRSAIFGTAALCMAAYSTTAVAYFYFNFNEGYKVELYGEVGFYCTLFLIMASLVWILVRVKQKR